MLFKKLIVIGFVAIILFSGLPITIGITENESYEDVYEKELLTYSDVILEGKIISLNPFWHNTSKQNTIKTVFQLQVSEVILSVM